MNWKSYVRLTCFILLIIVSLPLIVSSQSTTVYVAKVDGPINALAVEYIISSIEAAEKDGAQCLVLQLDTPGGLYHSTKDIVKKMLNADVPVLGVVKAETKDWVMELFRITENTEDLLPQKPPKGGIVYLKNN